MLSGLALGPLAGIKIIELAGIGPAPMAAMLLADLGATVLRVDRVEPSGLGIARPLKHNLLLRGRRAIAVNLKEPAAIDMVLRLIESSDALIEGFRPGVMERLGLGPEVCLARNAKLVYGRITGWGQTGPLAQTAGHDINYIGLTGALDAIGRKGQPPTPPLNILGDYAGGALYLALGVLSALVESQRSGKGQVVDAAIVDGVASLMTNFHGLAGAGILKAERGTNLMDSGAYFYDVYECADGRWLAVGPLEGKFFAELLTILGIDASAVGKQNDRAAWPAARNLFAARIKTRTQAEWCVAFDGSDACVSAVVSLDEAPSHPHMKARNTYIDIDGVTQPAPAPRFSRTVPEAPIAPQPADNTAAEAALAPWLTAAEVSGLRTARVLT